MVVVVRSNNPVELSWAQAVLAGEGIESVLFDDHVSAVEGSIGAVPRRLMVGDDDKADALAALAAARAQLAEPDRA